MRTTLLFVSLFVSIDLLSQGCSDAGFCTMGAMKPDQAFNRRIDFKLRSLSIQYYQGQSTLSPLIEAYTLEMNFAVGELASFQFKLPYQTITGTLGQVDGLGDISLSFTRKIYSNSSFDVNATLGGKIPTNDSRARAENGFTLPMYYQTSLGSYDFVAGISMISKKWLFAAGYQNALTSNNNDFQWGEWVRFSDRAYLSEYDVGIGLRRGSDVMLRAERNFRFVNYSFNFGVLPIYRVSQDQGIIRTRENGGVSKTTGLALSVLGGFTYNLDVQNTFKFIYGYKLTDRPTNPDGLTRDWVVNVIYEFRF